MAVAAARALGLALAVVLTLPAAALGGALPAGGSPTRFPGDAPPSPAQPDSNMGFKCNLRLDTVPSFKNVYLVAVPFFDGFADVADTGAALPCGGQDGVINADDLLCDWWTSRQGAMVVSRRDEASESWQSRIAYRDDATGDIVFAGGWTAPLVRKEAYLVTVRPPAGGDAQNLAVIVGSDDPGHAGQPLEPAPSGSEAVVLLNVPYHTMYATADEILCGLERIDWTDADGDGDPDTCPNGIFDDATGVRVSVTTVDNVPDGSPTDGQFVERSVRRDPATGALEFAGIDFELTPCAAELVTLGAGHPSDVFLSPHF